MSPRSAILLGFGTLSLASVWAAGGMPDRMISDRPCHDGWVACMVEGRLVNADPVVDSAGRPMPADLRVGFFDLKATASFSVHGGLSTYGADTVPQIPEEVIPEPIEEEIEPVDEGDGVAEVEPVGGEDGWVDPLFEDQSTGSGGGSSTSTTTTTTTTSSTGTGSGTGGYQPNTGGGGGGSSTGMDAVVRVDKEEPPPPPPPPDEEPVSANCEDLRQLEGAAMLGALSPAHAACLEERILSESSQTKRNKISRVLLINAESSSNGEWPRLIRRHLEEIDRSDPDMCLKYALHLSKNRGTSSAYGVIKWADYALERKSRWSGPTFTKRVYDLLKLRAHAANRLWQRANEDLLNAGANREELASKEEKSRGRAKSMAREWLDFARAASQNTAEAMALCVSTAGSKKFCKE